MTNLVHLNVFESNLEALQSIGTTAFDAIVGGEPVEITAVLDRTCICRHRDGSMSVERKETVYVHPNNVPIVLLSKTPIGRGNFSRSSFGTKKAAANGRKEARKVLKERKNRQ